MGREKKIMDFTLNLLNIPVVINKSNLLFRKMVSILYFSNTKMKVNF